MKDGAHFCAGEVCNDNDLATCCVAVVNVTTAAPGPETTTGTTPCSSTLPATPATTKGFLPVALALLPLIDKIRPARTTTTPIPTPLTTTSFTQGAQETTTPPMPVTTAEESSSSGSGSSSDLWWLWILLALLLSLFGTVLGACSALLMGKKKKKTKKSRSVEHRAPQGMPEEVYIEREVEPLIQEPLMPVAPLSMSVPTMVEPVVPMVPQPTMVTTSAPMMGSSLFGSTVPISGGMMSSSMPTNLSYGGTMPGAVL